MSKRETPNVAQIQIPVIEKGRDDVESWDIIREKLTSIGEIIYNKIELADV